MLTAGGDGLHLNALHRREVIEQRQGQGFKLLGGGTDIIKAAFDVRMLAVFVFVFVFVVVRVLICIMVIMLVMVMILVLVLALFMVMRGKQRAVQLNLLLKTAAIEQARRYPEARLLSLHPGTVVSPLSQPFRGSAAARPALQAAAELLAVVDNSKASDSGSFVAYDGASVPW